ncbi:MAG: RsmF rRNA methyltransferase first C-terminal domain-containing protein [Lachnospiraceae bacterium]|nr:RsmF rRNA methyltransferase first C-terminal domain-containing protein [Lachnospiraceae bacterium]
MNLPIRFVERMQSLLGEEYDEFAKCLDSSEYKALRLNMRKIEELSVKDLPFKLEAHPFVKNGFYYDVSDELGKSPYHAAGLYYIQEPSAMAPAYYLDAKPHEKVLDLCAAPGGKTTQIAEMMENTGLLVSNEINKDRARILSENIERMGLKNTVCTNMAPAALAEKFPEYFDRICVDAPCSGEGMFRKNDEAIANWSEENVKMCALRQAEILNEADKMLAPGGRMVYSTCTFAREENEETISAFIDRHGDYEVEREIRFFPHKFNGEGHFLAVLKKGGERKEDNKALNPVCGITEKELKEYREFEDKYLKVKLSGEFFKMGDTLYLAPEYMPDLKKLYVLRSGLILGEVKKGRFEPSHALSHYLMPSMVKNEYVTVIREDSEDAIRYLHGDTIDAEGSVKGYHLITIDSVSVGWGKSDGRIIKNHYPKGLRIMY